MRLLQEKGMEIALNMLNNIFIALRTPQSPLPPHKTHLAHQHFARLNAPCAQMPQECFLHSIHCKPCCVLQQREAVEQNVDAVGKSVHGVGTFSQGFYFRRRRG